MRSSFLLAQVGHDLRGGILAIPAAITFGGGALGFAVVRWEVGRPPPSFVPSMDTSSAQVVLGTVAGSMMTVVSITYSVLLMALSLASVQFSPRILVGFLRDRASQATLGAFLGTFLYSLVVLRAVRGEPQPYTAPLGGLLAVALAFVCLGSLVFFISRMAQGIQANFIVHRIENETRAVMASVCTGAVDEPALDRRAALAAGTVVAALRSGYVQLVDYEALLALAEQRRLVLRVLKAPGEFVVKGTPLVVVEGGTVDPQAIDEAFDLGPIRTMQQDLEYGLRQIVDVALKAISPAVNDPSTCVTCVDALTSLLAEAAQRGDPPSAVHGADGQVRLLLARSSFRRLVDLAFHQIRQYGQGDLAVVLRLVRALTDLAPFAASPARYAALRQHATLLEKAVAARFSDGERGELEARLGGLEAALDETEATLGGAV